MHESFLEDVNNIINTGEITNLYTKDDIENMTDHLTKVLMRKKIPVTKDNIYIEYIDCVTISILYYACLLLVIC